MKLRLMRACALAVTAARWHLSNGTYGTRPCPNGGFRNLDGLCVFHSR